MKRHAAWLIVLLLGILISADCVFAQRTDVKLLGDFNEGWRDQWFSRNLVGKATKYEVTTIDDSNKVLQAVSLEAASALWRMVSIRPGRKGKFSWRWKVENPLPKEVEERTKAGDDYAARIFVVFAPHLVSWKTRALCYVWAANAKVGSKYRSPYASSVGIVVVESGKEKKGKWVAEERDPIADYREIFGKQPELISAVAIMVDTDNTNHESIAWFDDLKLESSDPKVDFAPKKPRPPYGRR